MQHHAAPGRLAKREDTRGVTAERRDVIAHPCERADRVAQTAVRHPAERAGVEKAERAEPVVHRDHDDLLLGCQQRAVVHGLRRRADHERSAVEPHEHRKRAVGVGRPDVERQAARFVGRAHLHAGHDLAERSVDILGRSRTEPRPVALLGIALH